ncbi:hypothetical protein TDIS_1053 [Thermosulfurimonas dismutans]|uniref:Uncharacterized protein n=1 Tax=Thermosulfurimonas dismutans TaxID=999894 RepID=A0A179D4G4_9BACT|nr:hypothetical protein TDIS_1053 [Thermosulfurimonas dismutans]
MILRKDLEVIDFLKGDELMRGASLLIFFWVLGILPPSVCGFGKVFKDSLHGVEVDLPPGYYLRVPSGQGRILIKNEGGLGGLSIFMLKNPKSWDPGYFIKVFSISLPTSKIFYRKIDKNSVMAICEATYASFSPYFDAEYTYAGILTERWSSPVRAAMFVRRGCHYTLAMVAVPPSGGSLKDLFQVASSLKIQPPFRPFRSQPVQSVVFGIPAYYVDVPEGWRLENMNTMGTYGEIPCFCVKGREGGACYFRVWTQSFQSMFFQMPIGMAKVFVPGQGERPWSSFILSPEEAISLYLGFWGFEIPINVEVGKDVVWFERLLRQSIPSPIIGLWVRHFYFSGRNFSGEGVLGETRMQVVNMSTATLSVGYTGMLGIWWGESEKTRSLAEGVIRSIEVNPEWERRQMKVMTEEMRKEMAHRRWIWNEFRKTHDYISRLHRGTIKAEEVFQEEMARAYTNILSDYTYARDPETGEVFHLEDDAREYWRNAEGDIVKFEGEVLDPRALEVEGWRRLEVRPEGFGKW